MTRMVTKMNGLQSTNAGFVLSSGKKDRPLSIHSLGIEKQLFIVSRLLQNTLAAKMEEIFGCETVLEHIRTLR